MDDKTFELIQNMYVDLKSEIKSVKTELKDEILKTNILIEHDVKPQISALPDGYRQLAEGQKEIKDRLDNIEERIAHHDNEIALLKAGG
jgi:uncharacterized protein YydD (DUF2326 family)